MDPLLFYFKDDFIELWSIDQNGRLVQVFYNSSNRIPLYFLLSGDQIIMDNYAKESFFKLQNGAFGNFWKNTGNTSITYERFGTNYQFDTLLPYAIKETILPSILKSHFNNTNFSEFLQSKRTFILYDSFVDEEQRELINKMFFEIVGFAPNSLIFLNYWDIYRSSQISNKQLNSVESFVYVNTSLGNIYLHLIGENQPHHITKKVIEGKGRDPRVDTILDFIAEIAIAKGSQMKISEIKKEIANDGPKVLELLKDGLVMYTIKNDNIDFNPLKLNFHRTEVEGRLNNKQSLNLVQNEFDGFRRGNNAELLSIFLIGDVINQPVFVDFFKNTYTKVFPQNENFENAFLLDALKKCSNILNSSTINFTLTSKQINSTKEPPKVTTPPPQRPITPIPIPPRVTIPPPPPPKVTIPPPMPQRPITPIQIPPRVTVPPSTPPKVIAPPPPPTRVTAPMSIPPRVNAGPPKPPPKPPPPPPKKK